MRYHSPKLTVDGILVEEKRLLLIKRNHDPFKDEWALPGGFVEYGETTEDAIIREMKEETGLITKVCTLSGVYSDPKRDPRGHTVSIVYIVKKDGGTLEGGDDAAEARFFALEQLPSLAFDHHQIIKDAFRRNHDVLSKM
jgi:8-oxo-dGTP diphosphatase